MEVSNDDILIFYLPAESIPTADESRPVFSTQLHAPSQSIFKSFIDKVPYIPYTMSAPAQGPPPPNPPTGDSSKPQESSDVPQQTTQENESAEQQQQQQEVEQPKEDTFEDVPEHVVKVSIFNWCFALGMD